MSIPLGNVRFSNTPFPVYVLIGATLSNRRAENANPCPTLWRYNPNLTVLVPISFISYAGAIRYIRSMQVAVFFILIWNLLNSSIMLVKILWPIVTFNIIAYCL